MLQGAEQGTPEDTIWKVVERDKDLGAATSHQFLWNDRLAGQGCVEALTFQVLYNTALSPSISPKLVQPPFSMSSGALVKLIGIKWPIFTRIVAVPHLNHVHPVGIYVGARCKAERSLMN